MKRISVLLLLTLLMLAIAGPAYAQKGSITGTVFDAQTDEMLVGARIQVIPEGKDKAVTGAISKAGGSYQIKNISPGDYKVKVNYVGYKTFQKNVSLGEGEDINLAIGMYQDIIGLDEVVVTGVASRREKAVAEVSVARIDATELQEKMVYQDLSQMLAGKVSGMQVQTSSGNVGGGIRFQVRGGGGLNGDGQPVIFVDGTRIINNEVGNDIGGQFASTLADLNPEDIESIEILKGPAGSALYGTSGSNGVVLITTKSGKRQEDYFGIDYKLVTGWNEAPMDYTKDMIVSYEDANNLFRQGPLNENTISMKGKSGIFSYYASYTNRNEMGIVPNNLFSRESARANFEVFPSQEVSMRFSANYTWSDNFRSTNDNNVIGWLGNVLLFPQSYRFTDSAAIDAITNGLGSKRFIGSANFTYQPSWLPGLTVSLSGGYDGLDYRNDIFYPPGNFYTGPGDIGEKEMLQSMESNLNYDLNAQYVTNFTDKLRSSTIIGTQLYERYYEQSDFIMWDFANPKISNLNSSGEFNYANDVLYNFKEAGIYINEELSYDDTYFMTLKARQDFSSAVGVVGDAPNIFYPGITAAVRLDKFDFLPSFINFTKVRGGYGQSGVLPGRLAAYPLRWEGGQSGFGVGGVISSVGNPDIKPERISEIEVGLEMEFLNSYGFDVSYYIQNATESIIPFPNPPSTGLTQSSVPKNVGEIKSWGFESHFYFMPLVTRDFDLRFDVIFNYADNEIIDLGTDQPILGGFGNQGWYEGERRSAFIDRKVLGAVFDENGVYLGPDVTDDVEYLGTPIPIYTGSFSTSFRFFKNFTLGVLFEFATGHSVFNNTRSFMASFGNDVEFNDLSEQLSTLEPGSAAYREAAEKFAKLDYNWDGNYVEDADWLRLREISLRINATEYLHMFLSDQYIKNFNIVASVRNAVLWTKYGGLDPEVNMFGARTNVARGVDFLTLMNPRVFNFQVNFGF